MQVLATRRFFNKSGSITPRLLISLYTRCSSFQSDSRGSSLQKQARRDYKKERPGLNTKTSSSRMERGTSREKTGPPFISHFDYGNLQKKRLLLSFFKVGALAGSCWIFFVCVEFFIFFESVILLRSIEISWNKRKRKELRVLTKLITPVLILSSSPVPPSPY